MNTNTRQKWLRRKRQIQRRLRTGKLRPQANPALAACNIHYDIADRMRAIGCGGIGALHLLARKIGLIDLIDQRVKLLKVHLPYHESDHVLNIAYNVLTGGRCLEDIERLRNDEGYLDALGASRIPDPTTAGDFCRRFASADQVDNLMDSASASRTVRISGLNTQPARSPVNASTTTLRSSPHDSGPVWLATPSPHETFFHCTSPALPAHNVSLSSSLVPEVGKLF